MGDGSAVGGGAERAVQGTAADKPGAASIETSGNTVLDEGQGQDMEGDEEVSNES